MRKQRSLTPFMNEEFNTTEDNQDVVYWMLLYEAVMPVVFPVIIPFSRWKRNDYYIHHSPNHACAEIVLEGSMRYILDDQPVTVHANEMIILPIGLPNRVETGPDGFSRKVVFGLRGFLAEIILASFSIECGKVYQLKDVGKIVQMLSRLVVVYRKADPATLNAVSAAAFEILLEIRDQIHTQNGSSDVIQLLQMNIHTPCSIAEFSRKMKLSREKLSGIFQKQFKQSPQQYKTQFRMRTTEQLLRQTDQPVKEIAFQLGYRSLSRFATAFRQYHGCSPREYRKQKL